MTVVLHIGSHKTGTTALQRYASGHRDQLRMQGLWYPSYGEAGLGVSHYAHHHISHAVAGEGDRLSLDDARRFLDHVAKRKQPGETVLLSAEPIFRHVLWEGDGKKGDLAGEAFWDAKRAYLARLREVMPFDELRVLVYFRRQQDFAASMYQEHVKVTRYGEDFRTFITERRHLFDYRRHVEELLRVFPAVEARPFDELTGEEGLIRIFMANLGVNNLDASGKGQRNTSLPVELVEFKRLANRTGITLPQAKALGERLVELAGDKRFRRKRPHAWLSEAEMDAFQETFAADNAALAGLAGREGPFFPPAPERKTKLFEGLDAETALDIAVRAFPEFKT